MAEKKPPPSLQSFLDDLATGLDERIAEATAIVEAKRGELAEAEKNLRTLTALKGISEGKVSLGQETTARRAGGGSRAPRTIGRELRDKIVKMLERGPQPVAEIIAKVDPGESQRVRNSLALMAKNKVLKNKGGIYSL